MKKSEIKDLENFVKKIIKQKLNKLRQSTNPLSLIGKVDWWRK